MSAGYWPTYPDEPGGVVPIAWDVDVATARAFLGDVQQRGAETAWSAPGLDWQSIVSGLVGMALRHDLDALETAPHPLPVAALARAARRGTPEQLTQALAVYGLDLRSALAGEAVPPGVQP